MKEGQLLFHQGWTDIFNCLPLINYYLQTYDRLYVFIREDALRLFHFYCKQFDDRVVALVDSKPDASSTIPMFEDVDYLFHGDYDMHRTDSYQNMYSESSDDFVKRFYVPYDIPYSMRVTHFEFERDLELEAERYEKFTAEFGMNYVLQHSVPLSPDRVSYPIVELNQRSELFFDMIQVCERAKEMHLLDSSWACFLYLLDAKYGLFQHIPIYVYCMRDYSDMFLEPVRLANWHIMIRPA